MCADIGFVLSAVLLDHPHDLLHELDPVVHLELAVDVLEVIFQCVRADRQEIADLGGRGAGKNELQGLRSPGSCGRRRCRGIRHRSTGTD